MTAAAARGRGWAIGAAAALLSSATTAHAAEGLDTLLGRLAPPPAPHATVKVLSWVERVGDDRDELVITLVPEGKAKLVADPGVTVTPVARDGISWSGAARPTSRVEPGTDYFPAPPTLRLPFAGADGRPVEAAVEYAYCVVDRQCLFGETRVSAATTPQG